MIRWVVMLNFPADVASEAEEWYLNVHAPEVCAQPGLKKYFTYKALQSPFAELMGRDLNVYTYMTELWYEDWDAFKASVIDRPIEYTPPPFAGASIDAYGRFDSMLVSDTPELDFLALHGRGARETS